jgi:hypothetical protein
MAVRASDPREGNHDDRDVFNLPVTDLDPVAAEQGPEAFMTQQA